MKHDICKLIKSYGWIYPKSGKSFTIPQLMIDLSLNPDSKSKYHQVYSTIKNMRKGMIDFYISNMPSLDNHGNPIKSKNRYERWDILMYNYNTGTIPSFFLLFDRKQNSFIQPNFIQLEKMDKKRLENLAKGLVSIIEEMKEFDVRLEGRPAKDMLKVHEKYQKVFLTDGRYNKKTLDIVDK